MSSKIDIKHSSTPSAVPTTSSINLAEIAINTYDGKVYYKKDNGTQSIVELINTDSGIGTPGGSNTQIQFNGNGAFSGSPKFTFNSGSNTLTLTGSLNITGSTTINGDLTIISGSGDLYAHGHKQFSYGVFQNNTTLSGSANISYSFQLDTTDESHEVSIVSGSRITFTNAGVYNIQFSAQVSQGAGKATIHIWFKRNGTNIPESDTKLNVDANDYAVAAWNFMKTFSAGDYAEMAWQSNLSTTTFPFEIATGNFPAVPSIIVTVSQVR